MLSILNPPISPDVAVIAPWIVADVAVKAPAGETLNGALPNVACPNCIPLSASAIKMLLPLPNDIDLSEVSIVKFVPVKVELPITNPPILPVWAVISPLSFTALAVILPLADKWKLLELISNPYASEALMKDLPEAFEPIINVEELITKLSALASKDILSPSASPTLKSPVPSI